jgi:hypothetical protein
MTRTRKRLWIAAAVAFLLVASLFILNTPSRADPLPPVPTGTPSDIPTPTDIPAPVPVPVPTTEPTTAPTTGPVVVTTQSSAQTQTDKNTITGHTVSKAANTKSGTNCWTTYISNVFKNMFGQLIFKWSLAASWCANAAHTQITQATFTPYVTLGGQLWNLWHCNACPSGITLGGGTTYRYERADVQMGWCLTVIPFACASRYEWTALTVRPNGTSTGSTS